MSISIHIQAIIPVDSDMYLTQKAVLDVCKAAGVTVPAETLAFFDDDNEDREVTEHGIRVDIRHGRQRAVEGDAMYDDGALIDLAKLPQGTTKIRVYAR